MANLKTLFLIALSMLSSRSVFGQAADPALLKIVALQEAQIETLKNLVPAGAIMHFDLESCPTGWEPLASAQGRYLLGSTTGSGRGLQIGTALAKGEDRAVGRHNHVVRDPGHAHEFGPLMRDSMFADNPNPPRGSNAPVTMKFTTDKATTGISLDSAGATDGTNAPYVQYLVCRKK